ncbi:MAG: Arm DNA-binding domain-containing protein [Erythrobacter sp.]
MTRLTKRTVEALKSNRERDTFLWDSELRGLGVRVKPSGTKTFIFRYRNQEARTRRCVIGQFGVLTVEQARDLAQKKLAAVIDGADPSAERHSVRRG